MRRVFEASLKEADSVASTLKSQLEMGRNTLREQALESKNVIDDLKSQIEAGKQENSSLQMSKFTSEAELRDELHSLQTRAEHIQLTKEHMAQGFVPHRPNHLWQSLD